MQFPSLIYTRAVVVDAEVNENKQDHSWGDE